MTFEQAETIIKLLRFISGCRGCPFNPNLQEDLNMLEKYYPNERKACEIIFKPVYAEYRRIGYRLKREEQTKLF